MAHSKKDFIQHFERKLKIFQHMYNISIITLDRKETLLVQVAHGKLYTTASELVFTYTDTD